MILKYDQAWKIHTFEAIYVRVLTPEQKWIENWTYLIEHYSLCFNLLSNFAQLHSHLSTLPNSTVSYGCSTEPCKQAGSGTLQHPGGVGRFG